MRLMTLLAPTAEPISLSRAKAHLRVDHDEEDSEVLAKLTEAREYVEGFVKQRLVRQTLTLSLNCFPRAIELPVGPCRKVSSITYYDSAGALQTLSTAAYQADIRGGLAIIVPSPNYTWPDTEIDRLNAVTVTFVAGHLVPFTTDVGSDANALNAVAHPFANGDVVQLSRDSGELPKGLLPRTNYYVVNATTDAIELSLTSGGSPVAASEDGNGDHFIGLAPAPLLSGILLMLGHLWENREQEFLGTISNELNLGLTRVVGPYANARA